MTQRPVLVITSIAPPNPTLRDLAEAAKAAGIDFVLIGDEASPPTFALDGCDFYGLDRQRELELATALACPTRHYARKNIGYLLAMQRGATTIVETDDDTVAYPSFWEPHARFQTARVVDRPGWVNVYRYFSDARIWPRGLPLDEVRAEPPEAGTLRVTEVVGPIQQGLVDGDPDVDAIYRLLSDLPFWFDGAETVALAPGAWCPFNSQNTTWLPEAYPLLYLPSFCSFRMTDIWRSFVAQRIGWTNSWSVLFHAPTVRQARNAHDLMHDFRDEVPGYLANREICDALEQLDLWSGIEHIDRNLRRCYELLVDRGWLDARELALVDAWLADVATIREGVVSSSR